MRQPCTKSDSESYRFLLHANENRGIGFGIWSSATIQISKSRLKSRSQDTTSVSPLQTYQNTKNGWRRAREQCIYPGGDALTNAAAEWIGRISADLCEAAAGSFRHGSHVGEALHAGTLGRSCMSDGHDRDIEWGWQARWH